MGTDKKGCRVLMGDAGFALQLLLAFGGGIISFLSPCVLPLLPGYLGLMSGYSVADLQAGRASTGRMLRVTSLFVAGFTVVFVATGAAATQVGRFLVQYQSVTERVAGALILAFGVLLIGMSFTGRGLFGVFARERRLDVRPSRLGRWAPPVMGMAFGFGWTPCIGAILGAILTAAGTRETIALVSRITRERGLTLLFTEHDMAVVFSIAEVITVLHQGRVIAEGTPGEVRQDPEVRRVYLGERR
jgi:cytochrome c biogenesis protein CcdA